MILTILVGLAILAVWGCCTFAVGFGCGTYVGRWIGVELEPVRRNQQVIRPESVIAERFRAQVAENLRRLKEEREGAES